MSDNQINTNVSLVRHLLAITTELSVKIADGKPHKTLIVEERKAVRAILKTMGERATDTEIDQVCHRSVCFGTKIEPLEQVQQPVDRPWKGARLISLFSAGSGGVMTGRSVVGVRKRSGKAGFEAAQGSENWGYRTSNGFQGYIWSQLLGVFPTAAEAEACIRTKFADAKPTRRQDKP